MASRFTEDQKRAIQELVGLPSRLTSNSRSRKLAVPFEDLRRALGLAGLPGGDRVAEDRWLVGGSIMRWLCGGLGKGSDDPGDIDFFFPSLDALNETGRDLLRNGCTFHSFRTYMVTCQLCGGPGERLEKSTKDHGPRVRCATCGDFGGPEAATLTADRLLRLTPQIVSWAGMVAVQLRSPRGEVIHLGTYGLQPTLAEVVRRLDYSVVQFGLDSRDLHFGPYTWTDLLLSRFRMRPDPSHLAFMRLRKYRQLGFRPYATAYGLGVWGAVCGKVTRMMGGSPERDRLVARGLNPGVFQS